MTIFNRDNKLSSYLKYLCNYCDFLKNSHWLFWTMAVSGSVDIFSWVYYMCPCNSALTLTVFPHPTHLSECWITHITFQGRTRCHCPSLWLVNDHPYSALIGWFKNVRKHIQTDSAASTSNTRFNQDNT